MFSITQPNNVSLVAEVELTVKSFWVFFSWWIYLITWSLLSLSSLISSLPLRPFPLFSCLLFASHHAFVFFSSPPPLLSSLLLSVLSLIQHITHTLHALHDALFLPVPPPYFQLSFCSSPSSPQLNTNHTLITISYVHTSCFSDYLLYPYFNLCLLLFSLNVNLTHPLLFLPASSNMFSFSVCFPFNCNFCFSFSFFNLPHIPSICTCFISSLYCHNFVLFLTLLPIPCPPHLLRASPIMLFILHCPSLFSPPVILHRFITQSLTLPPSWIILPSP